MTSGMNTWRCRLKTLLHFYGGTVLNIPSYVSILQIDMHAPIQNVLSEGVHCFIIYACEHITSDTGSVIHTCI